MLLLHHCYFILVGDCMYIGYCHNIRSKIGCGIILMVIVTILFLFRRSDVGDCRLLRTETTTATTTTNHCDSQDLTTKMISATALNGCSNNPLILYC